MYPGGGYGWGGGGGGRGIVDTEWMIAEAEDEGISLEESEEKIAESEQNGVLTPIGRYASISLMYGIINFESRTRAMDTRCGPVRGPAIGTCCTIWRWRRRWRRRWTSRFGLVIRMLL
jgi:hypothetical protein